MNKDEQIKEVKALGNGLFRFIDMLKTSERITEKDKKAMQDVLNRQYDLLMLKMKSAITLNEGEYEIYDALKSEDDDTCFNLYKGDSKVAYMQTEGGIDDNEYEVIVRKKAKN